MIAMSKKHFQSLASNLGMVARRNDWTRADAPWHFLETIDAVNGTLPRCAATATDARSR